MTYAGLRLLASSDLTLGTLTELTDYALPTAIYVAANFLGMYFYIVARSHSWPGAYDRTRYPDHSGNKSSRNGRTRLWAYWGDLGILRCDRGVGKRLGHSSPRHHGRGSSSVTAVHAIVERPS